MSALSFQMPAGACNAHLHIIDPAFPNDGKAAAQIGTVASYRKLAGELSLPRAVFVQAKPFALDNACLVDAIEKFGWENCRGIAVMNREVSDAELLRLHEAGVRGLRFSVWNPNNAVVSFDDCLPLSERVKDMGWNMQLHMSARQLSLITWAVWIPILARAIRPTPFCAVCLIAETCTSSSPARTSTPCPASRGTTPPPLRSLWPNLRPSASCGERTTRTLRKRSSRTKRRWST